MHIDYLFIFYLTKKIDRIKECEKLLVAIEVAAWLNDPVIILQAIVQCFGLLAPLIYYNIAYEPIVQILTHCMLVLEEVPTNVFQRKSKHMFESLQHMIACTTYYLTDVIIYVVYFAYSQILFKVLFWKVLKRFNKKSLSNYFNLIGRKLLGLDDGPATTTVNEAEDAGKHSCLWTPLAKLHKVYGQYSDHIIIH